MGLMTYGLPTFFLSLCNAGILHVGSAVVLVGFVFAGITQIIAGLLEYPLGDTFGMTAFISFGAFWITLSLLVGFPHSGIIPASSGEEMGFYFGLWGTFCVALLICTLRMTTAHQVLFSSLSILFFLLAFKEFTGSHALGLIAGYEGMFSAASGMYLAVAEIFESSFGQTILPIGKPKA